MCFFNHLPVCFSVVKLPFRSQLTFFSKKNVLRNLHTYIITNSPYEGICVEFEQKKTLDFLLSNCHQVLKIFYD